VKVYKSKN